MTSTRLVSMWVAVAMVASVVGSGRMAAAAPGATPAPAPSPPTAPSPTTATTATPGEPAAATAGDALPAAPPTREARAKAKDELKRGQKLINEKRYDEALEALAAARALDPRPEHLYNFGVAFHLKGDKRAALDHYRQFLASGSKNRPLLKEAQQYVAELEAEIVADDQARAARDKADADARAAAEAAEAARQKQALDDQRRAADEAARLERERRDRDRDRPMAAGGGRGKRAIGTGLLIAGGAALGVAVMAGLEASSANDELDGLEEGDQWTVSRDWLHDRGETAERRALIFGIAGAGLAAGGAVLYYLGERDGRERAVAVAPAVTARSAAVAISGRF